MGSGNGNTVFSFKAVVEVVGYLTEELNQGNARVCRVSFGPLDHEEEEAILFKFGGSATETYDLSFCKRSSRLIMGVGSGGFRRY